MDSLDQVTILSQPHWDGSRVLFEIAAGDERIRCAISGAALQDLSQGRNFTAAELLLRFVRARAQIEAIALDKLRARSAELSGTLNIWANDIDDLAPGDNLAPGDALAAARSRGGGGPTGEPVSMRGNEIAKGQKRSNREVKKPKATKQPSAAPSSLASVAQLKQALPKVGPNDKRR